jgi:hypothetical protein
LRGLKDRKFSINEVLRHAKGVVPDRGEELLRPIIGRVEKKEKASFGWRSSTSLIRPKIVGDGGEPIEGGLRVPGDPSGDYVGFSPAQDLMEHYALSRIFIRHHNISCSAPSIVEAKSKSRRSLGGSLCRILQAKYPEFPYHALR